MLADLSSYVLRTVPENGAGTQGKGPVYRGYDVGVEFNENYVDRLYLRAKRPLGMRIRNNNGASVAHIANHWAQSLEQRLSEGERRWIAALNASNAIRCAHVIWSEVPTDGLLLAGGEGMLLQAETLHRAELVARDAGASSVVHSFEFTTSRFVNFSDHLHSFEDRVWEIQVDASAVTNLDQLFDQASKAVDPKVQTMQNSRADLAVKAKAAGVIGKSIQPTEVDFRAYDDALKVVHDAWSEVEKATADWYGKLTQTLDLRRSDTVRALEISVVKSANGRHVLLLESPIPIDWRRTTLTLSRSSALPVASLSPSIKPGTTVKVSDAHRSATTDYWVELLAGVETVLDGFALQIAEDAASPSFKNYATFPQGIVVPAGKRLRIHAPSVTTREAGVGYLGQEASKLTSGEQAPFPATIIWLRLLDGAGQIVHQQVVQPEANFTLTLVLALSVAGVTNALLLPNSDGTRALILLKDQAGVGVPAGAYRFTFEFRRDISPEAPVLREAGRTTPEQVTLRYLLQ
jgi:hypothetical protein